MPIYAYKCESCGFAKDVLQKISDQALSVCPSCNAEAYRKQVTAAGFQLKGSGWYATDFKGSGNGAPAPAGAKDGEAAPAKSDAVADTKSDKSDAKAKAADAPVAKKPETTSSAGSGS